MNSIKLFAFADEASPSMDGQLRAMLRNHLDGLEIRNVDGTNVSDISVAKAAEVKKKLDGHGLSTFSIGSPIGKISIHDPFEPHLEKFRHTLELADILGAKNIRIFSFYMDGSHTEYADKVLERLRRLVDAAKNTGITLCHENEKGIFGDVASRCLYIHQNIPELGAVFDPANFVQCGQDTWEAYQMLKPCIRYMHVKDALPSGDVVPAGYGCGHVKKIIDDMLKDGIGLFTLEPHLTVFDGLAALERQGETSGIGAFTYPDSDSAFDAAVAAFDGLTERR